LGNSSQGLRGRVVDVPGRHTTTECELGATCACAERVGPAAADRPKPTYRNPRTTCLEPPKCWACPKGNDILENITLAA